LFFGYHQIWLHKEDEDKTSFITLFGTYCYMRMPKGLRNTDPTFCRMTKAVLKEQVGRNVLPYVNDIVVASKKKESYMSDLSNTFTNMREKKPQTQFKKVYFQGKVLNCLVSTKKLSRSHGLSTALSRLARSPTARSSVTSLLVRSSTTSVPTLWSRAILASVRQDDDTFCIGEGEATNCSLEERAYMQEAMAALRVAKEVLRMQEGWRKEAVWEMMNRTGKFSRSLANSARLAVPVAGCAVGCG
jgi:hypothetical protein